jgi:hypothetical protein
VHLVSSFPRKERHPRLQTHGCWSLLASCHCNAEASVGRRFFALFSLGKMSPSPSNAGLSELWRISVILCVGCGVALPGPVLKVGPSSLFDVSRPLGPCAMNSGNNFYYAYI